MVKGAEMSMLVEIGAAPDPGPEIGYLSDNGWGKEEAVLELWVNTETRPVTIRLAGVLNHVTRKSVWLIIEELLGEGYRDFLVQINRLETSDINVRMDIERLVTAAGGSLHWST
jgi:hypothetical protein